MAERAGITAMALVGLRQAEHALRFQHGGLVGSDHGEEATGEVATLEEEMEAFRDSAVSDVVDEPTAKSYFENPDLIAEELGYAIVEELELSRIAAKERVAESETRMAERRASGLLSRQKMKQSVPQSPNAPEAPPRPPDPAAAFRGAVRQAVANARRLQRGQ